MSRPFLLYTQVTQLYIHIHSFSHVIFYHVSRLCFLMADFGKKKTKQVPDIRDEETYGSEGAASVLDWKPQGAASEGGVVSSSRKPISALSPQTDVVDDNQKPLASQKAFKIVLAGDAAVGKSSFLMRLCKNEFRGNTSATLGVDFQMKTLIVDGEQTVLQLWDTAGQERFRSIAKSYFRRADGVLLLYDVTCEKSFLNVREWVDMIEDAAHESIPIMLVGNKADLRDAAEAEGQKCVPGYCGEKLAMVRLNMGLNWKRSFTSVYLC